MMPTSSALSTNTLLIMTPMVLTLSSWNQLMLAHWHATVPERVLTQSLVLVMFLGTISQISSQFLSLELLPRCCQLSLSLLEEFYWRLELEDQPPSMLNSSSRRDISDGTLLESILPQLLDSKSLVREQV